MEYETGFDYAGNLLNANSYLDDNLLTLSMSNASNYDFSDILNFSPLVDEYVGYTSQSTSRRSWKLRRKNR